MENTHDFAKILLRGIDNLAVSFLIENPFICLFCRENVINNDGTNKIHVLRISLTF